MVKKYFLGFFLFIMLLTSVFSYQIPLEELGFKGISITGESKRICENITVNLTELNETKSGILSLESKFEGVKGDNSHLSVKINDNEEIIFWPNYFSCNNITNVCYARAFVPNLSKEETKLEICLVTGGATEKAELYKTSFIGLYDTPVLVIENIAPESIMLGEKAKMRLLLKNIGSKDTNFFVQFVSKDIRSFIEITSFDIVEGSSSANGIIQPGESKEFNFAIKPAKVSSYNLPYSMVRFDNIFGEEQILISNHPQLKVLNPDPITINMTSLEIENKLKLIISVKNNRDSVFLGKFQITPTDLIVSSIDELSLNPFEEKEFVFFTNTLLPGQYNFLAKITDGNSNFSSNNISYSVKKDDLSFALLLSIFAIILALSIFYLITFVKQKK